MRTTIKVLIKTQLLQILEAKNTFNPSLEGKITSMKDNGFKFRMIFIETREEFFIQPTTNLAVKSQGFQIGKKGRNEETKRKKGNTY